MTALLEFGNFVNLAMCVQATAVALMMGWGSRDE